MSVIAVDFTRKARTFAPQPEIPHVDHPDWCDPGCEPDVDGYALHQGVIGSVRGVRVAVECIASPGPGYRSATGVNVTAVEETGLTGGDLAELMRLLTEAGAICAADNNRATVAH